MALSTRGDDIAVTLDLTSNGAAVNASASSFSACVLNSVKQQAIAPVAQSSGASGADWATGVIVVEFGASLTAGLIPGHDYYVELQEITASGKRRTYPHITLEVQEGTIP